MAVATKTKGRNLAPYLRLRRDDLEVLVARELVPLAPALRISTRRWITKGFQVEFPGAPACPTPGRVRREPRAPDGT